MKGYYLKVSSKIRPQNVDWIHVCQDKNQQ